MRRKGVPLSFETGVGKIRGHALTRPVFSGETPFSFEKDDVVFTWLFTFADKFVTIFQYKLIHSEVSEV
ncbi:hypothetical protein XI25_11070 [Paenibacillus sp. DMB20]|nr:hypothetical protein XI25_17400 [Paenibacillus sp. DMB20]KKO53553.1 hypothetical protein XI25_11070 [Paenibacillus sp. DMB20]